jgi:hypothetical protein
MYNTAPPSRDYKGSITKIRLMSATHTGQCWYYIIERYLPAKIFNAAENYDNGYLVSTVQLSVDIRTT